MLYKEAHGREMEDNPCKVSFETAKEMMDARPDHRILDVRSEEEYITGHADGAVLLPLDTISEESARAVIPAKDTLLLVYCRSGRRSAQAARLLTQLGYTQVYDMGSLVGWPYGMAW
jgi:rhodanese-related sulfurtransferase